MVPVSLLPELRKLGDDVLSFPKAIDKVSTYAVALELNLVSPANTLRSSDIPSLLRMFPSAFWLRRFFEGVKLAFKRHCNRGSTLNKRAQY